MTKFFISSMLAGLIIGCTNKPGTPGIISRDKMEVVLWDFIQADVFTEHFIKRDSLKNPAMENMKLQQQIFAIHHISKDEFYKSYSYYTAHTDLMKNILDSITVHGEKNRGEMIKAQHTPQK